MSQHSPGRPTPPGPGAGGVQGSGGGHGRLPMAGGAAQQGHLHCALGPGGRDEAGRGCCRRAHAPRAATCAAHARAPPLRLLACPPGGALAGARLGPLQTRPQAAAAAALPILVQEQKWGYRADSLGAWIELEVGARCPHAPKTANCCAAPPRRPVRGSRPRPAGCCQCLMPGGLPRPCAPPPHALLRGCCSSHPALPPCACVRPARSAQRCRAPRIWCWCCWDTCAGGRGAAAGWVWLWGAACARGAAAGWPLPAHAQTALE